MRFAFEENASLAALRDAIIRATDELLEGRDPQREQEVLKIGTDVAALVDDKGFYVLRQGSLTVSFQGRELFMLEEGDAIMLRRLEGSELSIQGDFATICDYYSIDNLQGDARTVSTLLRIVGFYQALIAETVVSLHRGENRASPAIRSIAKGEAIVKEGEISDQVYTLIEGHAIVSSGGETVGQVQADELIGVIGALCGIPRIATVTASVDSLVMSLPKEDFVELLALRPQTVIKLIEDFARIISESNQTLRGWKASTRDFDGRF